MQLVTGALTVIYVNSVPCILAFHLYSVELNKTPVGAELVNLRKHRTIKPSPLLQINMNCISVCYHHNCTAARFHTKTLGLIRQQAIKCMLRTGEPYNGEEKGVGCGELSGNLEWQNSRQSPAEVNADRKGVMHEDKVCCIALAPDRRIY